MKYFLALTMLSLLACNGGSDAGTGTFTTPSSQPYGNATSVATLAGGCFWCIEAPFEKVPGVVEAVSGYTGGSEHAPSYRQVSGGATGHTEAVQVHFDSTVVTYAQILDYFWRQFDPTDAGGSFVDRGSQYRSGIFFHNDRQREIAEESRRMLSESGRFDDSIVTPIQPLDTFWVAEEYHQDFYKKSARRYQSYREGSGRDAFIDRVWGEERTPDWPAQLRQERPGAIE